MKHNNIEVRVSFKDIVETSLVIHVNLPAGAFFSRF